MTAANHSSVPRFDTLDHYWSQIKDLEPLSQKEEFRLVKRTRNGDDEALDQLLRANLSFVGRFAREYMRPEGPQLMELVSDGNAGLLEAVDRFDAERGFKFITYAVWWIRQAILKTLSNHGKITRLPASQLSDLNQLDKVMGRMAQNLDREPTPEELARHADMSLRRVRNALDVRQPDVALDAPTFSGGDDDLHELLEAPVPTADAAMESAAIKSTLAECMQLLDRRESHIVDAYFGMTCHPKTLEEIGGEIGLTRERVRQLRNRALKKMRDAYGDLLMQMCSN